MPLVLQIVVDILVVNSICKGTDLHGCIENLIRPFFLYVYSLKTMLYIWMDLKPNFEFFVGLLSQD